MQPKEILKLKIMTEVKILAEKTPLTAQLQCFLPRIETAATPAPSVVETMN